MKTPTEKYLTKARMAGYKAALAGLQLSDCPCTAAGMQSAWLLGFIQGQRDLR